MLNALSVIARITPSHVYEIIIIMDYNAILHVDCVYLNQNKSQSYFLIINFDITNQPKAHLRDED